MYALNHAHSGMVVEFKITSRKAYGSSMVAVCNGKESAPPLIPPLLREGHGRDLGRVLKEELGVDAGVVPTDAEE